MAKARQSSLHLLLNKSQQEGLDDAVVIHVYDSASPETRTIYELGGDRRGNWVIEWYIARS